jgi:OmpA-OmpF porin, OOP family
MDRANGWRTVTNHPVEENRNMKFRTAITYAVPVALATMLSAGTANALFYNNVYELDERVISGDSFNADLAREYQALARYESKEMYDWIDAENHAVKGNMAAMGNTPMPYDPTEWGIESQAQMDELKSARGDLMGALDGGARESFPALAATAQAKYDCWVEQQEEGHQPAHIAACRTEFGAAMTALATAMTPKPVAEMQTTVSQEIARETVYFDFDRAVVTPESQAKIDAFVSRMKAIGDVELAIVGHTDTVGGSEYNQALSAERARAVEASLVNQGMTVRDLNELDVIAKGEADPAVETGDGVREPRNRRTEIVAIGEVEVNRQVSSLVRR